MAGSSDDITAERRPGGVWWITIDRAAKHNALGRHVLDAIARSVAAAGAESDVCCVILTGAGDRYFAAGGDLKDLASIRDEAGTTDMAEQARTALDALRNAPIPVIAYLNGDAIGGGAELALACDMRLLSSRARIGFIQAKLAITSAWGGGPDLCQLVGPARAMSMMSRCELVGAEKALAWGLADAVIDPSAAEANLAAFLDPLLAAGPRVLRGIKAQTRAWKQGSAYADRRSLERSHFVTNWLHDDHWAASEKLLSKANR